MSQESAMDEELTDLREELESLRSQIQRERAVSDQLLEALEMRHGFCYACDNGNPCKIKAALAQHAALRSDPAIPEK